LIQKNTKRRQKIHDSSYQPEHHEKALSLHQFNISRSHTNYRLRYTNTHIKHKHNTHNTRSQYIHTQNTHTNNTHKTHTQHTQNTYNTYAQHTHNINTHTTHRLPTFKG